MASTFLTSEEPYLMDSSAPVPLDFSTDLPVSNSWRYDSWGAPVVADNFGVDMDTPFDPLGAPQQDSDESVTDLDEIPSPTPSSPSSDEVHNFELAPENQEMHILDQSPEMFVPEFYNDEDDDESTDSATDSFDTAEPSSVASPSSPIHNAASTSVSAAAAPATTGKRRGRPRTNKPAAASAASSAASAAPSNGGGRKRKADSINSETLLGTKKAKTSSSTAALVDRLPSSISAVELQGMSSAEYDSYFAAVSSKLSRHEIELAKLQRRRIKNRESASNSRVRKQDNLADLETQVQQLREQNEALRQKAMAFQSEQKAMSRELDTYKRLVREHLPPEFVPSFFNASSSSSHHGTSSSSTEVIHVSTRTGARSTRTLARDVSSAALMCLVLFAMIWGTTTVVPGSVLRDAQLPFGGPSRFTFPVGVSSHLDSASSAMAPVSSSSSSSALITSSRRSTTAAAQAAAAAAQAAAAAANAHARTPVQGDGDWLAQVISRTTQARAASAAAAVPTSVSIKQEQQTNSMSDVMMMNEAAATKEISLSKTNEMAVDGVLDSLQAHHTTSTEAALLSTKEPSNNDTIIPARLSNSLATSSSSASTSASSSSSSQTETTYSPEWKQNTTYIMCDNMQQVIPPTGAQPAVDPSSPLYVSLWVNPSALSASPIPSASKDPFNMDYLVQITCQIMSVDQLGLLSSPSSSSLPSVPSLSLPSVLAESSS